MSSTPDAAIPSLHHPATPLLRHLFSSAVDAVVLIIIPLLWSHWAEWAQYTDTFGRRWPAAVAYPVLTIIPLTAVWVEAVTGRGPGKWLTGLKVVGLDRNEAGVGRRFLRAAVKWSPAWVGPVVRMASAATGSPFADDWTFDTLLASPDDPANAVEAALRKVTAALTVSLKGMNVAALLVPVLAVGYLLVFLPGRRGLLDRVAGTRVARVR